MEAIRAGQGSSPLARGLPALDSSSPTEYRIIPARAGFTPIRAQGLQETWDHPRSRGVYAVRHVTLIFSRGSSPLARGLRRLTLIPSLPARIIPARAGFTYLFSILIYSLSDHPRSRGVYLAERGVEPGKRGSSPLARGLPPPGGRPPAAPWDHPRSRGVYLYARDEETILAGSSPLARGLPGDVKGEWTRVGIIPARAGFTPPGRFGGDEPQDHPRSRGVYLLCCASVRLSWGSSPLARGLRQGLVGPLLHVRIIPARAGFTGPRSC